MLVAVACGPARLGGQGESDPPRPSRTSAGGPTTASPSATTRPAATADPGEVEALLGDHFFDPQRIVIGVGAAVTWRNSSGSHNVTARDGSFVSPTLGDSFTVKFDRPGRYPFFCTFHPAEMQGEVVVQAVN